MKNVKPATRELTSHGAYVTDSAMVKRATPAPEHSVQAVASRVKVTQDALGVKAAEICRRSGIGANQWSQWRKGRNYPDLMAAIRLADEFDVTLDWIYRGKRGGLPHDFASKLPPASQMPETDAPKVVKIAEARRARRATKKRDAR